MSKERDRDATLGRRRLLVLGATATVIPACSDASSSLGDPYGGTGSNGGASGAGTGSSSGSGGSSTSSGGGQTSSASSSSSSSSGSAGSSSGASGGSSASSSGGSKCSPPTGNVLALSFSQYPQLQKSGGSVTVSAKGYSDPMCRSSQIVVFQDS